MVYEADKFPFAQIYDLLGHVESHMNDCDLFILWVVCLVGEEGIIYDPGLRHRKLWVVQTIFILIFTVDFFDTGSHEVETQLVSAVLFVDY